MGSSGKGAARTLLPGRIVLQADASPEGLRDTDDARAEALGVRLSTLHRGRQPFVADRCAAARQPQRPRQRPGQGILTDEVAQRLIALAGGEPPRGHRRWPVRWLADRLGALG